MARLITNASCDLERGRRPRSISSEFAEHHDDTIRLLKTETHIS